jgi:hypothetical protein
LPAALKRQDLTLVKSEQSDVAVLASLTRVVIPVDESVAKYDVAVCSSGKTQGTFAGSDVLSAKGLPVQGACRKNSENLEWLKGADRARGSGQACHKRRLAAPDGNWQVISGRSTPESLVLLVVDTHEASQLAILSEL